MFNVSIKEIYVIGTKDKIILTLETCNLNFMYRNQRYNSTLEQKPRHSSNHEPHTAFAGIIFLTRTPRSHKMS